MRRLTGRTPRQIGRDPEAGQEHVRASRAWAPWHTAEAREQSRAKPRRSRDAEPVIAVAMGGAMVAVVAILLGPDAAGRIAVMGAGILFGFATLAYLLRPIGALAVLLLVAALVLLGRH